MASDVLPSPSPPLVFIPPAIKTAGGAQHRQRRSLPCKTPWRGGTQHCAGEAKSVWVGGIRKNKFPPFQLKDLFVQRERRKGTLSMRGRKHTATTQEAQLLRLVLYN